MIQNTGSRDEPLLPGNSRTTEEKSCFQRWAFTITTLLVLVVIALVVALGVVASKSSSSSSSSSLISANLTRQIYSMRDTTLDPCDDFYQYACNGWFQQIGTGILNTTDSFYYSFTTIQNLVSAQQLQILQAHFPFITAFYDQCLDTNTTEAAGITELTALLTQYDSTGSLQQFLQLLGANQARGLASTALFTLSVQPDNAFADAYRAYLQPSGISAARPSYYTKSGSALYFTSQVAAAFVATGRTADEAATAAQDVWEIESTIAQFLLTLPDTSDQGALINNTERLSIAQFNQEVGAATDLYFTSQSARNTITTVDVITPTFFTQLFSYLNGLVNGSGVSKIRNYLKWHVIFGTMQYLPSAFRAIGSNLTKHGFPGNSDDGSRESFCTSATINEFADLVSHEWILKDFTDEQKRQATVLVDVIYKTIGQRIEAVPWLDNTTRINAMNKWSLIVRNVGYSNDWLDYSTLSFTGTLLGDLQAISYFMTLASNSLFDQTVDRTQMPTRDYMIQNAFYNPSTNNINLLAGLIFPPFFDTSAPMMLNFAAYGMVIGHEITHGFDNNGRLFNGTGAYVNWWSAASAAEFDKRAQCLVSQYDKFTVDGVHHVNGSQTLGENIADHGGINTAYSAYKQFAQPSSQLLNDISNDQLFFLYYAQNWCAETTLAFALDRLVTDVHSPARWRVNGPLSNKPEFAQAYGCSAQSKMGRSLTDERCELW